MKIIDIPQSGKIGLQVSMPGRYGQVRRAWIVPANPRTVGQLAVRARLTSQTQAFRGLTTVQQDAWNAAAATVQTRSKLGQSGPMTGAQLFTRINCNLALAGQDAVTVPPAKPTFEALAVTGLEITNTGGNVAVKLTCPGDPGENTFVRASAPCSSAIRRLPSVRILGSAPTPVTNKADITTLYTGKFGVPAVGQRLFVECFTIQDGWQSPAQVFTAIVPE